MIFLITTPQEECSHESIKQLVIGADSLIRSEIMKKVSEPQVIVANTSYSIEKENICMDEPANIQKVQVIQRNILKSTKYDLRNFSGMVGTPTIISKTSSRVYNINNRL